MSLIFFFGGEICFIRKKYMFYWYCISVEFCINWFIYNIYVLNLLNIFFIMFYFEYDGMDLLVKKCD